jgi:hypothetical protein
VLSLDSTVELLERECDQLIPLVVEGPAHLRSLRLRQLRSIERQLVAAQAEQAKIAPGTASLDGVIVESPERAR